MTGGSHTDKFVFDADSGNDIITDFTLGEDKIDLLDINFGDGDEDQSTAEFLTENAQIEDKSLYLTLGDGRQIVLLDVVHDDEEHEVEEFIDIFG